MSAQDLNGYVIVLAQTGENKFKVLGCPEECHDIQHSDEIIEVNGRSVRNCPRDFLSNYIKQCLKSRNISLRVRRRKNAEVLKAHDIEKVHDAFVIAVGDETKQKLVEFTSGQNLNPVDMTKVFNGHKNSSSSSSVNANPTSNSRGGRKSKNKSVEDEEEDLVTYQNPVYNSVAILTSQADSSSMPGKKKNDSSHEDLSRHEGEEWNEMENFDQNEDKSKGKWKMKNNGNHNTQVIQDYLSNGSSSDNNRYSTYSNGQISGHSHNYENSYREMAIDVPDNFIASVKSPPRYPPHLAGKPRSNHASSSPSKSSNRDSKADMSHSQSSLNSTSSSTNKPSHFQPTPEDLKRIHKHQEELKKRREEESRLQAEENFLRESLRGSKKLHALESNRRQPRTIPAGFDNTAFDDENDFDDDDDIDGKPDKRRSRRRMLDSKEDDKYLKKNIVMEDVLTSLQHMGSKLSSPEDHQKLAFLNQMFSNEQFQNAVRQHNKVVEISCSSQPKRPENGYAGELTSELCYQAAQARHNQQAQYLLQLLTEPKMKNLLDAHDAIAQQALQPSENLYPLPDDAEYPLVQFGEESVKIIHLEKTNEHLGATVKNEGDSVVIARIVKGGVAEKTGLLHEGDEILEVNGIDMCGRNINEVSEMLANMTGILKFIIVPGHMTTPGNMPNQSSVMDLRALFSYDPEDDDYIPCKELGISFIRGDILHAIALDDPNWWQAFREGEEDEALAGLIPSKTFQEQREKMKTDLENKENKRKGKVCACGKKEKKKKKKRKSLYNGQTEDEEEIMTYEEISRYYPQPNRKRPIVLIGPSNVGRQELQQRLLESDPDRFGAPIPHTTRTRRANEVEGGIYHYISRDEFQLMIAQTKFLEYGELQRNFYGTSIDVVRAVVAQGKVCLLKLQPQSLKVIRASDLKPYVVFVCPPNLEKLRQLQDQLDKASPQTEQDGQSRTILTNDQLKEIIDCAREMEDLYGHLFDFVMVNSDLDRTYTELLDEINRIEMEPQWVPASWVDSL